MFVSHVGLFLRKAGFDTIVCHVGDHCILSPPLRFSWKLFQARSNPAKFVLKPQREGGANNYYNEDIPKMLDEICGGDGKEKAAYILMDRITPMEHLNVQLRPGAEIKVGCVN